MNKLLVLGGLVLFICCILIARNINRPAQEKPVGMAFDATGNLYVPYQDGTVRKVSKNDQPTNEEKKSR